MEILDTTASTLAIQARMNVTNPTEYSATVPYVNINLLSNGTILGHATAKNISVVPGPNHDLLVTAVWDPKALSGEKGLTAGRELLSQYISGQKPAFPLLDGCFIDTPKGFNTTLTLKTHNGTIPSQPSLGEALSSLEIEIPTPKLIPPKNPNHPDDDDDDDEDGKAPHFIDDATVRTRPTIDLLHLTDLQLIDAPHLFHRNPNPPLPPSSFHPLPDLHKRHSLLYTPSSR